MEAPTNRAAWLCKPGAPLEVGDAPLHRPSDDEIVVHNAAIALNPLDNHMQDVGVFVQHFPAILGCDVAGTVHSVGSGVQRFKKGDRVIGHCINLTTGADADGAYQLFTAIKADKAAILPSSISFTDGVVLPFAIEAAACALLVREPGPCMPGVSTPALALPAPCLTSTRSDKILIVYGASSSAGLTTTQLAVAGGMIVLGIAGTANHDLVRSSGASAVFDHNDPSLVDDIVSAVRAATGKFVGIFDAISVEGTYARDLDILHQLGGGHLATTHPPPQVPSHVQAGMIFAVNDVAGPVFSDFVTPALESGKLKPLPCPFVVGRGLDCINVGLQKLKAGVSGSKIVVEL